MTEKNKFELIHIDEPQLTFGYSQLNKDPRDGITLFGPFSRETHKGEIKIGVIGPKTQRNFTIQYLRNLHKPIINKKFDKARPFFPGLEAAFNISINFAACKEIDILKEDIDKLLKFSDSYQRVFRLSDLYANNLIEFCNEEHEDVSVWFVVIPDEIYQLCRPNSKISKSEDNIDIGLDKKDRFSDQNFLFEEMTELKRAYEFEINFHNQLKFKLLKSKVVTQILRESTIAYEQIWNRPDKIEYERLFDTPKAWNIGTTLYYKSGGLPWKLGDIRKEVCYLGLVYKKLESTKSSKNACCAAQMFLDSGDGMVFRGNIGPWYNPISKEYHISKKDAFQLLSLALESFRKKSNTKSYPKEIFIHSKTYFDDEEWQGFADAANGKSNIIGIRISTNSAFKLYREFSYCIPRGSALITSEAEAFLWTKGYIPRIETQLGLETPNPLHIKITRGESKIKIVCKDIMALTKLNYNSCIYADGLPVTLRFADSIGEVLSASQEGESEVLTFKHYI